MMNRAERVVKPEDCVLAFGIPLSQIGFGKERPGGEGQPDLPKKFASFFTGGWEEYSAQIVRIFEKRKYDFDNLKVKIITDLTLEKFGELFRDQSHSVITLFSHWDQGHVEFEDGFACVSAIAEKVPSDFDGILDLCVCHPDALVVALCSRQDRQYQVPHLSSRATPAFWLSFYWTLYHHLATSEFTYPKALNDVIMEFFKQIGGDPR